MTDSSSVSRDDDIGDAEQESHDGREGQHHDQIVHGNLHQRIGGIAPGELGPHEDHRSAGGRAEQDEPRDVLLRILAGDQR